MEPKIYVSGLFLLFRAAHERQTLRILHLVLQCSHSLAISIIIIAIYIALRNL